MYVFQLPKTKQLAIYKAVKKALIESNSLTVSNIMDALNSKLSDIDYLLQ